MWPPAGRRLALGLYCTSTIIQVNWQGAYPAANEPVARFVAHRGYVSLVSKRLLARWSDIQGQRGTSVYGDLDVVQVPRLALRIT